MNPTLRRLERLLVMVPWLLENPGTEVAELCARFEADRDEVLGDLDLLGYCGLPGYGGGDLVEVEVVGDRVTVRMADFFRRPLRLNVREAVTLLLAGRALAGVEGLPESPALQRAIARLETTLAAPHGGSVPQVAIDLRSPGDELLGSLRQAVAARRAVTLAYHAASRAEERTRTVEPWGLVAVAGAWYLQGWCRLAEAPRNFRVDRIRELAVTDEPCTRDPQPRPVPRYEPGPHDQQVVVDLDPAASWALDSIAADEIAESPDAIRVTFRVRDLEWALRLVLGLGGRARVVAPAELAERVRERAEATLSALGAPPPARGR